MIYWYDNQHVDFNHSANGYDSLANTSEAAGVYPAAWLS